MNKSMTMSKQCTGTIYKIDGKLYCVGEKLSKKGQPVRLAKAKTKKNKTKKRKKTKGKKTKGKKTKGKKTKGKKTKRIIY